MNKVIDLQYFPPITSFVTLYNSSDVFFDLYEAYRKMSFRNRCIIAGAHGPISLSIPLQHGRNQQVPVREVIISNTENWQALHIKALKSAYNNSPFFEYYRDELSDLFDTRYEKLSEWNLECLHWVNKKLNHSNPLIFTANTPAFNSEEIEDLRDSVRPKNYMLSNPVRYRQVFQEKTGFLPNLSILDLLFNEGPRSAELLGMASGTFK